MATTSSISAIEVNLLRGRSLEAASGYLGGIDGLPAGGVNDVGLTRPDEFVQRRRLVDRIATAGRR